jgi:multidrug efflux system outer membrane protein
MPCLSDNPWRRRICRYGPALLIWISLAMVTGCMVGPNFQRPQVQVPAQWTGPTHAPGTRPPTLAEQELARWWGVFQDPILAGLVETAIESNLDLKQAEARIRQARAARGIAASGLGPTVDSSGSFQRRRSPATSTGGGERPGAAGSKSGGVISNQYQAGFDAGWELDIFGGVRRGIEAADADLQAAVEGRRDVLVTLTAEVARNYVDLRVFQQQIAIARQNLQAQQHSAKLTRQRFEAGFVSGLDVANADAQVATTAAQIPLLEASSRQAIYNLGVLLGREPAALLEELSPVSEIPAVPPSVPVGIPSDLLRRRPDIRQAEAEIHAATARIGVATADLFPKFNLTGAVGFQAGSLGSLFDWISRFWSFGPSISWQVFASGRNLSNIELQKAFEEESLIVYRQTVLAALQEVENVLIASAKEQEHRRELAAAVAANRKAVDLATRLYVEGQTDFLNVLEAQRSLYSSEDALTRSNGTVSTNLIALYKALGGGWQAAVDTDG